MAVIAAIIGILALTAAAHYYYSTYNNEEPAQQYESYNPPQYHWNGPHDLSNAQESTIKDPTIKRAQNGLLSDPTLAYEIKSSTSQDVTTAYSTGNPQSTSTERGNEIGNAIGIHVVNKKMLKSKKYYKYKVNSKTKSDQTDEFVEVNPVGIHNGDHLNTSPDPIMGEHEEKDRESLTTEYSDPSETSTKYAIGPQIDTKNKYYNYKVNSENKHDAEMDFVDVDHAGASDPIMEKDKGNPSETRSTDYSIPSKGSTILGHCLTIVITAMVVLP